MLAPISTPNQMRSMPSFVRDRRQQRDDDEGDLEEIEEEGEDEYEDVDEDEEADLRRPAGPQQPLEPHAAADALEDRG